MDKDRQGHWQSALRQVERLLESMLQGGLRQVNLAPDLELARDFTSRAAPAATARPPMATGPRQPQALQSRTTRAAAPPPSRQAGPSEMPLPAAPAEALPPAPVEALPPAPAGTASARQADSLAALCGLFQDCQACKLSRERKRVVFGTGQASPRLMFIGEGPGAEEDVQGLPFVGRAGQLLTGLILALGLTREDVYITNVVKCRPPGNRNPEPDEVAACRPILQRQIELLNPRLIVVLGNVPLKALNPTAAGITRERGLLFTYQRWSVLPTFHPSYLLRSPDALGACWRDMARAFQLAYPEAAAPQS